MGDELDINASATLSCSALTAYGALKNAELKPNDNVVIVGAGGLGLMAIQLAKAGPLLSVLNIYTDYNKERLIKLAQWVDQNNMIVKVEKTFSSDEAAQALYYPKDICIQGKEVVLAIQ
jgi:D-arabinose 1-dehydrogenase-like Zn-dependent alcohol dehydrogenase